MQLIKPLEIASKIMGLIEEANEFMVIVSPYYRFGTWRKLNRVLEAAMDRNLPLLFYVREGEYASIAELTDIGLIEDETIIEEEYLFASCLQEKSTYSEKTS